MGNGDTIYDAIIAEDLTSIDECIPKELIDDTTYTNHYNYTDESGRNQTKYLAKCFTPLECAIENQSLKVIEHLLKRGADVLRKPSHRNSEPPLSTAVRTGDLEVVKLLLENGAKPSMQTALLVAIEERNLDIVKHFIEEGVCINWEYADGDTPLSTSIKNSCEEISKFLIDNGTHLEIFNDPDCTPFCFLDNVAKSTLQAGLLVAIQKRNLNIVKYLVERGVSVNWEYANDDDTPLLISIKNRFEEISKFLIDNGANLEKFTEYCSTPLIISVENQMLDTLKYLIKKGARIDQIDNTGQTALTVAAEKRNFSCAKYLIESGADINLAQKAVDEFAQIDEDFRYFLKLSTMKQEQLKSSSSDVKEASSSADNKCLHCLPLLTLSDKESGYGQEEAPSSEK